MSAAGEAPAPGESAEARAPRIFRHRFGAAPSLLGVAPGRVNLIGEHIDYCGGSVLPIAIGLSCCAAAGPSPDATWCIIAADDGGEAWSFDADAPMRALLHDESSGIRGTWRAYVAGVIDGLWNLLDRIGAPRPRGVRMVIAGDVPRGSGLSSSAALELAVAHAAAAVVPVIIEPRTLADLCVRAEREFAGVPCGIMDQHASALCREGHALLLDCATGRGSLVPVPESFALLIVDSRVRHDNASGSYAALRSAAESAALKLRIATGSPGRALCAMTEQEIAACATLTHREREVALHAVTEQQRVVEAAAALRARDIDAMGRLMLASHASLRDRCGVSCPELDVIVDAARRCEGVAGARLTGAGLGGCAVVLARGHDAAARAAQHIRAEFMQRFGAACETLFVTPGHGAHVVHDTDQPRREPGSQRTAPHSL